MEGVLMIRGIHLISQEGIMQRTHYEKSSHQGGGNNATFKAA